MKADTSYKKVWLQQDINSLKKKREELVLRISKIEIQIQKKEERFQKLLRTEGTIQND